MTSLTKDTSKINVTTHTVPTSRGLMVRPEQLQINLDNVCHGSVEEIIRFFNTPDHWTSPIIGSLLQKLLCTRVHSVQKEVFSKININNLLNQINSSNTIEKNAELKRIFYLIEWSKLISIFFTKAHLSDPDAFKIHGIIESEIAKKSYKQQSINDVIKDKDDYLLAYKSAIKFLFSVNHILTEFGEHNDQYHFESAWDSNLDSTRSELIMFRKATDILNELRLNIGESGLACLIKDVLYKASSTTNNLGFYTLKNKPEANPIKSTTPKKNP